MCGSFLLVAEVNELMKYYTISDEVKGEYEPGNFYPKKNTPIIISDGKRSLQFAKWGFPYSGEKKLVINARSESIMNKPMFRNSFYNRRCVVPANSFYEWKNEGSGRKVKYKIGLRDERIISLGGIYKISLDENSKEQMTFVIITTEATGRLKAIHHRMPLIVRKDQLDLWLNKSKSTSQKIIKSILANDTYDNAFITEEVTNSKEGSGNKNLGQIGIF